MLVLNPDESTCSMSFLLALMRRLGMARVEVTADDMDAAWESYKGHSLVAAPDQFTGLHVLQLVAEDDLPAGVETLQ